MRIVAALFCMLPLAACASGGVDVADAGIDHSVQTSSVGGPSGSDQTRLSDASTIRNAVSSVDVQAMSGEPLAWANSDTGSRGTISSVAETKAAGMLCRTFTASRESYDGVGLYKGEACRGDQGAWQMQAFEKM